MLVNSDDASQRNRELRVENARLRAMSARDKTRAGRLEIDLTLAEAERDDLARKLHAAERVVMMARGIYREPVTTFWVDLVTELNRHDATVGI